MNGSQHEPSISRELFMKFCGRQNSYAHGNLLLISSLNIHITVTHNFTERSIKEIKCLSKHNENSG